MKRSPATHVELKSVYDKRKLVKNGKQFALDRAKLAIEQEYADKIVEYEREMYHLFTQGFTVAELMRAYETTDRNTVVQILKKYELLKPVISDNIASSVAEVFSWGEYRVPDVTLFDGRVIDGWDSYGLRANFRDHGNKDITFDSYYQAVEGDDGNWTFEAAPLLDEPEDGANRVLHNKDSMYYKEANEWSKKHREEYKR